MPLSNYLLYARYTNTHTYVCMVNKLGGSRVSFILFFILFITFLSLSIYCFLAVFSFFWSVTRSFIVFMPYNNWRSPTGKSELFFCYHHIMSTITLTYISKERIILYLICWMTIMSLRQSVSFILCVWHGCVLVRIVFAEYVCFACAAIFVVVLVPFYAQFKVSIESLRHTQTHNDIIRHIDINVKRIVVTWARKWENKKKTYTQRLCSTNIYKSEWMSDWMNKKRERKNETS